MYSNLTSHPKTRQSVTFTEITSILHCISVAVNNECVLVPDYYLGDYQRAGRPARKPTGEVYDGP